MPFIPAGAFECRDLWLQFDGAQFIVWEYFEEKEQTYHFSHDAHFEVIGLEFQISRLHVSSTQ